MPARVRLNAFDKNTSGSHSLTIEVESVEDFFEKEKIFDVNVPFTNFYFEHEVLDGDDALVAELEDHII